MDLSTYAAGQASAVTTCRVCALDLEVREQIDANELQPTHSRVSRSVVKKWLRDNHGVTLSADSIRRHAANHLTRD